ncbi:DUF4197 domain-containing protein [bacterium AH-315-M05]|nr:DUF4197 domain-containing protein [bacterium AH-315-M05]
MRRSLIIIFIALAFVACTSTEILKGISEVLQTEEPLTNEEVGRGLKEALTIGIKKGADMVSKEDGYFKNSSIKIPFPPDAIKVANKLRDMGFGQQVDKVILTLNRGAEHAAKEAKPIFISAIKQMTFTDVMLILKGEENAATEYLKRTTSDQLRIKFKPVIQNSLDQVGATKYWTDVINIYNKIPFIEKVNPDLNEFVTQKAMNGLFFMIAKEEAKIRKDPLARVTDLLKRVFG